MRPAQTIMIGAVAGAAGTLALDLTTYADMVWRARPTSGLPGELAARLAAKAHISLEGDDEATKSRKTGLGAILGYASGVSLAVAYAALVGRRSPNLVLAAVGLGACAMAAADIPLVAEGLASPRQWAPGDWLSDIVPHIVYGLTTVSVFEYLRAV